MQAAVLESRGREGLHLRQFPDPLPAAGEAVLKVHAVGLNRVDLYMRDSGIGITHSLPLVQGVEAAGVVAHAPAGSGLRVGQKAVLYSNAFCGHCRYCRAGDQPLCVNTDIMGEHRHGALAEYVAMPSSCFMPLPDDADLVSAGALMVGHLTAWRMLFGKARPLQAGETVMIVGIGGGVAAACLELAQLAGARAIVTSSSDDKLERARGLGAEAGINYRTEKVSERVMELTGGEGVDMMVDSVGQASWGDSLRSLRRGGRLLTCGATTGSQPGADLQRMFIRQLEVYGSTGGSVEEFRRVVSLFGRGRLKPVIDRVVPLAQYQAAFDRLGNGEQFGKVVVSVA
ncbi:zinc-binding dehydrogenase [Variovorax paradoxus]|nr:zinc-binding dehydrogenase [Variovorax paradoxus]MBT2301933.1 zinc-binding dehydrogenase [Variovorax paradoxus]